MRQCFSNMVRTTVLSGRGLTMKFGAFVAVNSIDLDVYEGDIHALVGPNGAGKSTLLNLFGGQLRQTSGTINLLGRSLGSSSPHVRARLGIGRSFQLTSVVPGLSCLENVVLAVEARRGIVSMLALRSRAADDTEARHLLELVGLADAAAIPADLLGHGRQKQLEVAIALGGRPKVLLLDEPASGLSGHERQDLSNVLGQVAKSATILMAEHDIGLVRQIATRVSALSLGHKLIEGTADEVLGDPAVQAVFLRGQASA